MKFKVLALTNQEYMSWYRRLGVTLYQKGIGLDCLSKMPEPLNRIKEERYNLVLLDSANADLENISFYVSWGCRIPLAVFVSNSQNDLSGLHTIGIDTIIPRVSPEEKIIVVIEKLCTRGYLHSPHIKVLLIEDDKLTRDALRMYFRIFWPEAEIDMAASGKEGINLFHQRKEDLILLDLGLPDISGFEVLEHVRSYSQIPVLILTANRTREIITRAIQSGADDYIIKPFQRMELMPRIKKTVDQLPLKEEPMFKTVKI